MFIIQALTCAGYIKIDTVILDGVPIILQRGPQISVDLGTGVPKSTEI